MNKAIDQTVVGVSRAVPSQDVRSMARGEAEGMLVRRGGYGSDDNHYNNRYNNRYNNYISGSRLSTFRV